MLKYLFALLFSVLFFTDTNAQKTTDTLKYFVDKRGNIVDNKEESEYVLLVLPETEVGNKTLYPIVGLYKNGKTRMLASTSVRSGDFVFEGSQIVFSPNGKRSSVTMFEKGLPVGDQLIYYPNGKLYTKKQHKGYKVLFMECRDSTGVVLAENGNGEWLDFDQDFNYLVAKGPVKDGLAHGNWEYADAVENFKNGVSKSYKEVRRAYFEPGARELLVEEPEYLPQYGLATYRGGWSEIQKFIDKNMHYSATEGDVSRQAYVCFFVENNGKMSDFKVLYAPSKEMGEEALRVLQKLPPLWTPLQVDSQAVRWPITVPVYFKSNNIKTEDASNVENYSSDNSDGFETFKQFFTEAHHYPRLESVNSVSGKVYLELNKEKDGPLFDLRVLSTPTVGLAEEAIKVMKMYIKRQSTLTSNNLNKDRYILSVDFTLPKIQSAGQTDSLFTDTTKTFVDVEKVPAFPGGMEGFGRFLVKNVKYPQVDRSHNVTGRVLVTFVVEKDGTLSNLKTLSSPSISLAEEAIRVMKLSPNWLPGRARGEAVRVKYTIPISFTLGGEK